MRLLDPRDYDTFASMVLLGRTLCMLTAAFSCAACDRPANPARAYVHWGDRLKAVTGGVLGSPCTTKVKHGGAIVYSGRFDDTCYRFDKAKRFRGTWRNEFEGSKFCSVLDKDCDVYDSSPAGETWLDFERPFPSLSGEGREGIYRIDLIGRKTMFTGKYGHGGLSDHAIMVDRIIELEKVSDLKEF